MKKVAVILLILLIGLLYHSIAQPIISLNPVITTGLNSPMQFVHAADGSKRIFIVQKAGSILVYNSSFNFIGTFLTVTGITSANERGLLSMAFHPDYSNNGFFYVYYTNGSGDLEIARYQVNNSNPNLANASSKVIVITIPHPTNTNHNGGELHFGKDGYLYLSTGDGGGGGDPNNNAQNTSSLLGKMLRFNVNTSLVAPFYSLPENNPYNNEVFAYGLRNPFRWSFDRLNDDMWIGDVGQNSWEEINYRKKEQSLNSNYGWRCYEGNAIFNTAGCGNIANYVFPAYTYATQNPSAAITGGNVYRGRTYIDLYRYYISADFYSGKIYITLQDTVNNSFTTTDQTVSNTGIADFGETEDGELFAVSLTANAVYRVSANGSIRYIFTGTGNWNVASNWSNNTIPPTSLPAGSEIIIAPEVAGTCILNIQQTILPGASLLVDENKKLLIEGDLIIQ